MDQAELAAQEADLEKGEFTLETFRQDARADEQARPARQSNGHDPRHGRA